MNRVGCGGGWWGRVSAEITPMDSRIPGKRAASAAASGPGREAMSVVAGGSTEGEEGGWMEHRSLSVNVHVQALGSSWVTQNNHVAISSKRHVLCSKMMFHFIFGKRQQWGVPSEVSSLPDMRGEGAG